MAAALGAVLVGLFGYALSKRLHRAPATELPRPQVYNYKPDPRFQAGVPLRPMDIEILEALARGHFDRAQLLDLFPGRPYHVKLIGSPGDGRIDLLAIDLDRNGIWDEQWRLKPETVERRTFDKEGPGIPFVLRNGRWLPY